ncbi:hypothetical protein AMECASPLE_035070 [Ameca splendens]|uniref:CUB domain-containing protein n=1 Tax=Ameca splendens TaxID=208324 RepID=A0ABV0ZG13_9TELE
MPELHQMTPIDSEELQLYYNVFPNDIVPQPISKGWTEGQSQANSTDLRPMFPCGGHLVTDSGIVASEEFPNYYKPNSKCTWYITVSESLLLF